MNNTITITIITALQLPYQHYIENILVYFFIPTTLIKCISYSYLTFSLDYSFYFMLSTTYSNRPATKFSLTTHHLRITDLQHCIAMTSYNCQIQQTGTRAETQF